jgi:hypothetical protein
MSLIPRFFHVEMLFWCSEGVVAPSGIHTQISAEGGASQTLRLSSPASDDTTTQTSGISTAHDLQLEVSNTAITPTKQGGSASVPPGSVSKLIHTIETEWLTRNKVSANKSSTLHSGDKTSLVHTEESSIETKIDSQAPCTETSAPRIHTPTGGEGELSKPSSPVWSTSHDSVGTVDSQAICTDMSPPITPESPLQVDGGIEDLPSDLAASTPKRDGEFVRKLSLRLEDVSCDDSQIIDDEGDTTDSVDDTRKAVSRQNTTHMEAGAPTTPQEQLFYDAESKTTPGCRRKTTPKVQGRRPLARPTLKPHATPLKQPPKGTDEVKDTGPLKHILFDCGIKDQSAQDKKIQSVDSSDLANILERWKELMNRSKYATRKTILKNIGTKDGYGPEDVLVQMSRSGGDPVLQVMKNYPKERWGLFFPSTRFESPYPITTDPENKCPSCGCQSRIALPNPMPDTSLEQTRVILVMQSLKRKKSWFLTALYLHTLVAAADWLSPSCSGRLGPNNPTVLLLAVFPKNPNKDVPQPKKKVEKAWNKTKEIVSQAFVLLFAWYPDLFNRLSLQLKEIILVPPKASE